MKKLCIVVLLLKTFFILAEKKKPNVLVILVDDIGTGDIPGYYSDSCKVTSMKNIESLVSKGVLFTDAHATPLCAPSRYSFLSGNYPQKGTRKMGSWSLRDGNQFKKGQKSLADVFKKAGYNTAMMGKWHLGGRVMPHGLKTHPGWMLKSKQHDWSQPFEGGPQDIGFQSSLITIEGVQKGPYAFFRDGILEPKMSDIKHYKKGTYSTPEGITTIQKSSQGDKNWDSAAYNMILVKETEHFLDEHLQDTPTKPFFAYVATGSAHGPYSPPDKYIDGTPVKNTQPTRHMDMLFELDLVVGSLVKALEDRKVIEDTIIVFVSDNGGSPDESTGDEEFSHYSNGPLKTAKGSLNEGGHHIPLIMRYDNGLPSGEKRDNLVGITDLFATLSEMAGISVPTGQAQDSISFAEYAKDDKNTQNRRWSYGIFRLEAGKGNRATGCAIRTSWYKLIRTVRTRQWGKSKGSKYAYTEFYDLTNDPNETKNLVWLKKYKKERDDLLKKLKAIGPCCIDGFCVA